MTIPKLTPYTGEVANPDGSQTQSEFTTNMFNQLSYEANLATELDATIDGMNNAVDEVSQNAAIAKNSANAAEAAASSADYQGLWPDTGGSAEKGDTYQTQVGGTPTGEYYTALQNTSVDPVGDNVNWKADVSGDYVNQAQEELIDGSIFPAVGTIEDGDIVEPGITHLRVLIGGQSAIVAMSPVANGAVSSLTESGAIIGTKSVKFNKVGTKEFKYLYDTSLNLVIDGAVSIGDKVVVDNYRDGGKSGILFFRVVPGGTGVHDGGKYIDLPISGLQLEQNLRTPYCVMAWGAFGDGVNDDENHIRNCHDYVISVGGGKIHAKSSTYRIGGNFYIAANIGFFGDGNSTIFKPENPSGTHGISVSNRGSLSDVLVDGVNSQGYGVIIGNNAKAENVRSVNFKGETSDDDGAAFVLEGAYSSTLQGCTSVHCRRNLMIGKHGSSAENNSVSIRDSGFEFSLEGILVNKANLLTLDNVFTGNHGGNYGADRNGTALNLNNEDISCTILNLYTEHCTVGIRSDAKSLEVLGGRFSNKINILKGQALVKGAEFYGLGAYVDAPNGSTGVALLLNNTTHNSSPLVGPINFENRVKNLSLNQHGLSFGGGFKIFGDSDFEVVDASRGVILKAPNTTRYRLTIDNSGNIVTTAI